MVEQMMEEQVVNRSFGDIIQLRNRESYLGPMVWKTVSDSNNYQPGLDFSFTLRSSGSFCDIMEAYLEYTVNLNAAEADLLIHNYFQYVYGYSVRIGNITLKSRNQGGALPIFCAQRYYKDMKQKMGLNQESVTATSVLEFTTQQTPTRLFLSQHNVVPNQSSFNIRVPLVALFPELCMIDTDNSLFIDNESGIELHFFVGRQDPFLKATNADAAQMIDISHPKIVYREGYLTPDLLNQFRSSSIPINVPFYDIQCLGTQSGQFNFSLTGKESYKRLLFYGTVPRNLRSNQTLITGADDYANILSPSTTNVMKMSSCMLPLEIQEISIDYPGRGRSTITREKFFGHAVTSNHYMDRADNIFKFLVDININKLPYDKNLDYSVVGGVTTQLPHQMTVQYKLISSVINSFSVPIYGGADMESPDLSSSEFEVNCVLEADKQFVIKGARYHTV